MARLKAPIATRADGLVQVFANCSEEQRREYQSPVARFAADTVATLYRGLNEKPVRFERAGIVIHIGDGRTNDTSVIVRVATNGTRIVSRIYLRSPGSSDLERLRTAVVQGFCRSVRGEEISEAAASDLYDRAQPGYRLRHTRATLEDWLAGKGGDDEENMATMRKVLTPGRASPRDVLIFASRLFLYPPAFDQPFLGKCDVLSFRDAVRVAKRDPRVRFMALAKADEPIVFGGGRGEELAAAAADYAAFLRELARFEKSEDELLAMLDAADAKLAFALEVAAAK